MYLKTFACAAALAGFATGAFAQTAPLDCSIPANAGAAACLGLDPTPVNPANVLLPMSEGAVIGAVALGLAGVLTGMKSTTSTD